MVLDFHQQHLKCTLEMVQWWSAGCILHDFSTISSTSAMVALDKSSSNTGTPGECQTKSAWCTNQWTDLLNVTPAAGLLEPRNRSSKSPTPELTHLYSYKVSHCKSSSETTQMVHQLWPLPSDLHRSVGWKDRPSHSRDQWSFKPLLSSSTWWTNFSVDQTSF